MRARAWWIFGLAFCAACGLSFPDEYLIEDLRILEIRSDPPEIPVFSQPRLDVSADELGALTPNFQTVRFSALVAHPDLDASFSYDWIRCVDPRRGLGGFRRIPCDGDEKQRLAQRSSFELAPVETLLADLTAAGGGAQSLVGGLAEDPRDLFTGFRLFMNLQARVDAASEAVDTPVLEGVKRLVVFDPTIVSLVLREARRAGPSGIPQVAGLELPTLCTNVDEAGFSSVLDYLESRRPNRSPRYTRLEFELSTDTSTQSFAPSDPPIELSPGDRMALRGRVESDALETFRLIDDNCALIEFQETMAWSWFTNLGTLSRQLTSEAQDAELNTSLRTVYTAPAEDELEEARTRVRIWSVLRDGRGGSDHRFVDVLIVK